jgi:hypothetical protein
MDGKGGLLRLFRWACGRPQSSVIDPADVGTAFGLELAMGESSANPLSSEPKTPQLSGPNAQTKGQKGVEPRSRRCHAPVCKMHVGVEIKTRQFKLSRASIEL